MRATQLSLLAAAVVVATLNGVNASNTTTSAEITGGANSTTYVNEIASSATGSSTGTTSPTTTVASGTTGSSSSSSSVSTTPTATTTTSSSSAMATSTTSASTSAMIPSNISTTCSTFLTALDSDSGFTTCMTPLVNLTAAYSPTASDAGNLSTTTSDITATLESMCATSSGCSDALIRSYLADYYTACADELTTDANEQIRLMYDYLYVVNPFLAAVCGKDASTATYCVLEIADGALSNATSSTGATDDAVQLNALIASAAVQSVMGSVANAAANLVIYTSNTASTLTKRFLSSNSRYSPHHARSTAADVQSFETIVTPNTTTYRLTSLPYLFLQPNSSASLLCTSCAKSILSAYVAWEAQVPYALGLSSSPILGAQAALWTAIGNTCGTNFTTAITTEAGVLISNGTLVATSGAVGGVAVGSGAFVALAMAGLVGLGMSVLI